MRRMAVCCAVLLFAALFSACAAEAGMSFEYMLPAPSALPAQADGGEGLSREKAYREPISYTRTEQEYGESSFISYPYIMDAEYDVFNGAIEEAIGAAVDALETPAYIRCDITCNDCGIFSVRITVRDLGTNDILAVIPMTFGTETGEELNIADLFDPLNERWRGLIPDIVMLQAEKAELRLLSDVMPASDTQLFYVTEDALVILYRPYEIATYSAGWPEFSIPLDQLSDFLLPDGALMHLAEGGGSAEEAAGEYEGSTETNTEAVKP